MGKPLTLTTKISRCDYSGSHGLISCCCFFSLFTFEIYSLAKSSPRPPWVLASEVTCTSADQRQEHPDLAVCEERRTRSGCVRIILCGESAKSGEDVGAKEGGECGELEIGEGDKSANKIRWGEGIFFHESIHYGLRAGCGFGYGSACSEEVQGDRRSHRGNLRSTLSTAPSRDSKLFTGHLLSHYCTRSCYSTLTFRPKSANIGFRTRLACCQGYDSERLGHIFECPPYIESSQLGAIGCRRSCPDPKHGVGLSRKVSTLESRIAAGFATPEPSPREDKEKPPEASSYASEFLRTNPCLAYLPSHKEEPSEKQKKKKKKKKKKKGKATDPPPPKKCMCEVHVNTVPMNNTKFTETDFLTYDQCTWTDNPTDDKGEGTEKAAMCDQFTNVTPYDIDGPPPLSAHHSLVSEYLMDDGELFRGVSFTPSKKSFAQQLSRMTINSSISKRSRSSHALVTAADLDDNDDGDKRQQGHTLVEHPATKATARMTDHSAAVTVPASFAKMSLGKEELPPPTWDGIVCSGGEITCCPPCVGDPSVLSRFWRRTPKFCDVVRTAPICDCCCLTTLCQRAEKADAL